MITVVVPKETVNDESVTLLSWMVAEGLAVEEGQPIAEVEGSKATFHISAPAAGIITFVRRQRHNF